MKGETGAAAVPRVLLVDDRRDNLLALEAVLEPLGLDLVSARSGAEALSRLLAEDFALLILDVQMPVLDGFETARLIKSRERTRHIPIIFLTAISGTLEHHLTGYERGAVDYVAKPFEPEILRAKVRVLVELWNRGTIIERQAAELSARLSELDRANQALAEQAVELERSNAALARFAEVSSSELREPLCNVAGFLDLLADRHGASLDGEAADLVERASAGAARMLAMVDELLDYAQVSTGEFSAAPVALDDALAEARDDMSSRLATAGAVVTVGSDLPVVDGDRRQLVRLFANLIDNAVRFRTDEPPEVRVTSEPAGEGRWRVSVCDNGSGMEEPDLARVFTVFSRARPGRDSPGVGLAVCRRIVERHGGTIGAERAPAGGTEVWFELAGAAG